MKLFLTHHSGPYVVKTESRSAKVYYLTYLVQTPLFFFTLSGITPFVTSTAKVCRMPGLHAKINTYNPDSLIIMGLTFLLESILSRICCDVREQHSEHCRHLPPGFCAAEKCPPCSRHHAGLGQQLANLPAKEDKSH